MRPGKPTCAVLALALGVAFSPGPPLAAKHPSGDGPNGDTNGDGHYVLLDDVVYLLSWLFLGGRPPASYRCREVLPCRPGELETFENGDVNGDHRINVADAVYLLRSLFLGGPPPVPLCSCRTPPGTPLPFLTIRHEGDGGRIDGAAIIRDRESWAALFPESPPAVDFRNEMVLAVGRRDAPASGHYVTIDRIVAFPEEVFVFYTLTAPSAGCGVDLALTDPHHYVRTAIMPGLAVPVEEVALECANQLDFQTIEGCPCASPYSCGPQVAIIRDQESWETFCGSPPPGVDFQNEMVVALRYMFPSTGYLINIDWITAYPGEIRVFYTYLHPPADCPVLSVITPVTHYARTAKFPGRPVLRPHFVAACGNDSPLAPR